MFRNEPRIIIENEQDFNFTPFVLMEDVLDKLKILSYEKEFLKSLNMKPIHKYYFVVPTNPGEQFYLFSQLSAWLINKCGKSFNYPQESDDPNDVISKIMNATKEMGVPIDFSANKLKQGVGEQVVFILDNLTNEALKKINFTWKKLIPPTETIEEKSEQIDDDAEINLDRIEEEMIAAYSDDSDADENLLNINQILLDSRKKYDDINNYQQNKDVIKIDEEAWKLELERVLPQLKVTIRNDNRDWRSHLDQMKQLKDSIDNSLIGVKGQLDRIHKDIVNNLDKVNNREKYLNRELSTLLDEYRGYQDQLSKYKDRYKNVSGGVTERNRELSKLTDRLETIKQQMEEKGSSMTDGTPLVNIKKAISKVESDIVDMDVRIGVLECILLQSKIRDEKVLENEFGQSVSVF